MTEIQERMAIINPPQLPEIINRLIEVQQQGKATVFFEMSGHVNRFSIRVFVPVWYAGAEPSYEDWVYMEGSDDDDPYIEDAKQKLFSYLNKLP